MPKEKLPVVEDNDDMRELLGVALQEAGYEPAPAVDGAQALEIIGREREALDRAKMDPRHSENRRPE